MRTYTGRTTALRVLVSNDDGVDAPGIRILAEGLRAAGHDVTVVAPDRDRCGASNSLTLDVPVRVRAAGRRTPGASYGTPTDCVHVAHHRHARGRARHRRVRHQQHRQPRRRRDLFRHRRRGDGRPLPRPAGGRGVAGRPPTTSGRHYETAARAAVEIIARLAVDPLPADTILNVNVPDLPWDEIARLRGHAAWATAIAPKPASRSRIRAAASGGGSAPPAPSRTPAPAPISTPCAPATSRSRRSTST